MTYASTNIRNSYKQITAGTAISSQPGAIAGIFVSSATGTPTITVYDNTANSGAKVIDTFTPVAGTYYNFGGANFRSCYVDISGTVSATVMYF